MNRQTPSIRLSIRLLLFLLVPGLSLLVFMADSPLWGRVASLDEFAKLAIMENGRLKPLDTFARNALKQISGRSAYDGKPAIDWLARVVFTPRAADNDRIFLVTNLEVLDAITVSHRGKARDRFTYTQLQAGLPLLVACSVDASKKNKSERSPVEEEMLTLYHNLYLYRGLSSAFDEGSPLTILPPPKTSADPDDGWQNPWDVAREWITHPDPTRVHLVKWVQRMRDAYAGGSQADFDAAVRRFNRAVRDHVPNRVRPHAIALEVWVNRVDPFVMAPFFYGFAFISLLLSLLLAPQWFYRGSLILLSMGAAVHVFGEAARLIIMQRPPVTNLYETFVFTALMTVILGIILEYLRKNGLGILAGSLSGMLLLLIAGKYAGETDTMGMLTAVLDSNFWLASHVISITLGYAGMIFSGLIGHVYILQRLIAPGNDRRLHHTFRSVYGVQAFGLLFTFLGTVLGGIWADQSWGRFWGWDPKENGALLVLLWSVLLFHSRRAGWIKDTGFALGTIGGIIAVAMGWFGVNLLGIGLHSYGFTPGIAVPFIGFVSLELLFIITALIFISVFELPQRK